MGPVKDTMGVEQGGPNSRNQPKLCNNEQFTTSEQSRFGIEICPFPGSSIGQADDSVLISTDIHQLSHLLQLTLLYCHVEMTPEKTKLQVFTPRSLSNHTEYMKTINYLSISGVPLTFTSPLGVPSKTPPVYLKTLSK